MRLAVVSDLHVDTNPWDPPAHLFHELEATDGVIIAGDISDDACQSIQWIAKRLTRVPVFFVFGNHEYRSPETWQDGRRDALEEASRHKNIHVLDCSEARLGDLRILGCNLWVDFAASGNVDASMATAHEKNPDHRLIRERASDGQIRNFSPESMLRQHYAERRWLEDSLRRQVPGMKTIVVTHFPPLTESITIDPGAAPLVSLMASDLGTMLSATKPKLWIHGHIHHRCDYRFEHTRILANPRGSPPYVNRDFMPLEIIKL